MWKRLFIGAAVLLSGVLLAVLAEGECRNRYKIHNIGMSEIPTVNFYILHKEWIVEEMSMIPDLFVQLDCVFGIDNLNIYSRFIVIGNSWSETTVYKNRQPVVDMMKSWTQMGNYRKDTSSFLNICRAVMSVLDRVIESVGKHTFEFSAKNFIFFSDAGPSFEAFRRCQTEYLKTIRYNVPNAVGAFFNFIQPSEDKQTEMVTYSFLSPDKFVNDHRCYLGTGWVYFANQSSNNIQKFALAIDNQTANFGAMFESFSKSSQYVHLNFDHFMMKNAEQLSRSARLRIDILEGVIVFALLTLLIVLVFCACICAAASAGAVQDDLDERRQAQRLAGLGDMGGGLTDHLSLARSPVAAVPDSDPQPQRTTAEICNDCGGVRGAFSEHSYSSVLTARPSTPRRAASVRSADDSGYLSEP